MVTKPNKQSIPSAAEGLKKMPKIEPAQLATVASQTPKYMADPDSASKDLANKDHKASFKMPEKVTQKEIHDQSFKYGGGRSAGNRSLVNNMVPKVTET